MRITNIAFGLTILSLIAVSVILYSILISHDISLQPIFRQTNTHPVYLISYADGAAIYFQNQNALAQSAINKGIDFIYNYTKKHIDPDFIETNTDIFSISKGAGLWLWKPWLIQKTLQEIPENAILIYADTSVIFRRPVDDLIALTNKRDIVLIEHPRFTRDREVAPHIFAKLKCNEAACTQGPASVANFMLLRNSKATREFIAEWLQHCLDRELFIFERDMEHPSTNFFRHAHDQSILSAMAYKHRANILMLDYDFACSTYIAAAYRKPNHKHNYSQNPIIYANTVLGPWEKFFTNSRLSVNIRKSIYTKFPGFPWNDSYTKDAGLEENIVYLD